MDNAPEGIVYTNMKQMDGLYYACAARDAKLADQELYFADQLYGDEFPSFVGRFFCS